MLKFKNKKTAILPFFVDSFYLICTLLCAVKQASLVISQTLAAMVKAQCILRLQIETPPSHTNKLCLLFQYAVFVVIAIVRGRRSHIVDHRYRVEYAAAVATVVFAVFYVAVDALISFHSLPPSIISFSFKDKNIRC